MSNIAVIMSVYRSDSLDYLKDAINSILTQTFKEFTLFIYRDGSVSTEIDEYLSSIDSKNQNIKLIISDENTGLANALNTLIDIVILDRSFTHIARMDSDDISREKRFEKQICFFENNSEVDVAGTSCREFGSTYALDEKHLPTTHQELLNFSITRCPFIHPSVMFRLSVFEEGNRYPIHTAFTEDMALWFNLLKNGYRFGNLNEILLDYRLNEDTVERRKGFAKALSEVRIRTENMFALKQFSIKNLTLIFSRIIFHLLPTSVVKFAYKKAR